MARPRIARNAEQAAKIPIEQPIQIEIPPEGEVIIPAEQSAGGTVSDTKQAPQPPVPTPLATKQDDDEVTTLKSQLDQLKRTSEDNARRAQEAAAREQELRRQYEDQGRNFQTVVTQRGKAELAAIEHGLAAAQAEAEAATQEIAAYGENQDWGGLAKAQVRQSRATTRLVQLEDAKVNFEARLEEVKRLQEQAAQQPQQSGDPVEQHIATMQGVNNAQKEWLRAHPDSLSDPEKNSYLRAAHYETQRKGISAGSPEYFQYLEEKLGYRQAQQQDEDELPPQSVAAPPSREAPSATGRTTPTRVTLTAEERQIAASAGISEIEYAKQKLRLQELKRQGQYRDGG